MKTFTIKDIVKLKFENMLLKKELELSKMLDMPVSKSPTDNSFIIPGIERQKIHNNLDPTQTFDNYVCGEYNKLAYRIGKSLSQKSIFNPFFIYGPYGNGKTHLVNAIGNLLKDDKIVYYTTAYHFHQDFLKTQDDLFNFYKQLDVIIIDDIQELAGKNKTQGLLLNILNELLHEGKKFILTSDVYPKNLQFDSKFLYGIVVELKEPDQDVRLKILQTKYDFPNEINEYLSYEIRNIREMEGVALSILANQIVLNTEITFDLAKSIIDKHNISKKKEFTIDHIQKVVCNYFNVPVEMLQSKTRKREIVQVRQVSMFFSKSLTKSSLATIGSQIGDKDHATVLHACKTVNNLIDTDKRFRVQIEDIEKKIKY